MRPLVRIGLLIVLAGLGGSLFPAAGEVASLVQDRDDWLAIRSSDFAVPEGQRAGDLLLALDPLLASPDPSLRDDIGYTAAARWIYRERRLSPDELRRVTDHWRANLRRGLGEQGTDSVFLRSFSALDLSLLAALDLQASFLDDRQFGALFDDALEYFTVERDVRGFDPVKGWMHSVAHTSDLLKFLARNPRLPEDGEARLLDALDRKLDALDGVLVWGEDERVAAVLASLARREDFDQAAFGAWLDAVVERGKALWANGPLVDPGSFARVQNVKSMLRGLFVQLSADEAGGDGVVEVRRRVLAALTAMP